MKSVVLEDDLLSLYLKFSREPGAITKKRDKRMIGCLMSFLQSVDGYQTTYQQLKRVFDEGGMGSDSSLLSALASSGFVSQSLDELAHKTKHKLILSTDESKTDYPYVTVGSMNSAVDVSMSLTCKRGESREYLIRYLEAMCSSAKQILISDKYLNDNWDAGSSVFFRRSLPRESLDIKIAGCNTATFDNIKTKIEGIFRDWNVIHYTGADYNDLHDRYLVVDSSIEIMLSSGFDYIGSDRKEITSIIRH